MDADQRGFEPIYTDMKKSAHMPDFYYSLIPSIKKLLFEWVMMLFSISSPVKRKHPLHSSSMRRYNTRVVHDEFHHAEPEEYTNQKPENSFVLAFREKCDRPQRVRNFIYKTASAFTSRFAWNIWIRMWQRYDQSFIPWTVAGCPFCRHRNRRMDVTRGGTGGAEKGYIHR